VPSVWIWLEQLAKAVPPRQREVVLLRYQRDLSDEDIGEILGLSASELLDESSRVWPEGTATLLRNADMVIAGGLHDGHGWDPYVFHL